MCSLLKNFIVRHSPRLLYCTVYFSIYSPNIKDFVVCFDFFQSSREGNDNERCDDSFEFSFFDSSEKIIAGQTYSVAVSMMIFYLYQKTNKLSLYSYL